MFYCSEQCQKADWRNVHKLECEHLKTLTAREDSFLTNCCLSGTGLLALRFCLKAHLDSKFKESKWSLHNGGERTIDDLMHHVDEMVKCECSLKIYQPLIRDIMSLGIPGLTQDTVLVRISQVFINSFIIEYDRRWIPNRVHGLKLLGHGLYVKQSVFDHSCVPNTHCSFIGPVQTIRATCEIDTDKEQVLISYLVGESLCSERNTLLRKKYYFECSCRLCTVPEAQREFMRLMDLSRTVATSTPCVRRTVSRELYEKFKLVFGEHNEDSTVFLFAMMVDQVTVLLRGHKTPSALQDYRSLTEHVAILWGLDHPNYTALLAIFAHVFN